MEYYSENYNENYNENYMNQALSLAKKGLGKTSPNPLVGAIIVKNNIIIGTGYHEKYGGPHAEINAFSDAKIDVSDAELYVTLEPCSHYGKTPPCVDTIIEKKIKRVIIGMTDPNILVSGSGIKKLQEAGIEIVCDILKNKCEALNEIFIKYIKTCEPFVIMKTAMTLDGKIATKTGDSKWVTCDAARAYVHEFRNNLTGIMVGINTVLLDNPFLTSRTKGGKNPIRIIVDSKCIIPENANVLKLSETDRCIVATTEQADSKKLILLKKMGIEIIQTKSKNNKVDLGVLMKTLGKMGIDSILLEGGGNLNFSMLEEGLVDKVISFIAPKIIGGTTAKTPVEGSGIEKMNSAISLRDIKVNHIGSDIMLTGYVIKKYKIQSSLLS